MQRRDNRPAGAPVHRRLATLGLLAGTVVFVAGAVAARPARAACSDLVGATLPGAGTVTTAEAVPAGPFTAPNGTAYPNLPAFCRVAATLRPSPDSDIKTEVWLPEGSAWNGRFVGTGNGGYGGAIRYDELAGGAQLGFATANQDAGTAPSTALDALALQRWVEEGVAPRRITATKYVADQPARGIAQTRPLCPYPRVARYRGQGDPNDAASFNCVPGGNYDNPIPAPEYRR